MSLQGAIKALSGIGSLFLILNHILAPVVSICAALGAVAKIFTSLGAVFNWIGGRKKPSQNTPPHDPAQSRQGTEINVLGKNTPGYSAYVQTTGLEADNASDVTDVLGGVRKLNTVGIRNGSAGTVITTGIRLGRTPSRARD